MATLLSEFPVVRELMNFDYVQTLIREHLGQVHNHNQIHLGINEHSPVAPTVY
jgi:hypothetical protein